MAQKHQDFSPRRIYWFTVTMIAAAIMLAIAILGGAAWALLKVVQQLPWHG